MKITIKRLTLNALIAALYINLTLITSSFAFRDIQFRVAEILILLCFFRKDYFLGLTLGCFIVNLFGPMGIIDAVIGSGATLISCLLISYSRKLWVAIIYPVVINAFFIGLELYFILSLPLWTSILFVGVGELTVLVVGYFVFMQLKKHGNFLTFIEANQNLDRI